MAGSDGRFLFNNCVLDSDLSFGRVQDGEMVTRDWGVWCNDPPDMRSFVDNGAVDVDTIARYYDAQLVDGDGNVLGNVDSWEPVLHPETKEVRLGGRKQKWKVPMGHGISIKFHQIVVSDAALFSKVIASLADGHADYTMNLQAVYNGRGG
jgi:hypothetical protein